MLKYVETKNAPAAIGPYSQGIICNGIAFFSGQIPLSPITGEVVGTTIEEQTEQVMLNINGLRGSCGRFSRSRPAARCRCSPRTRAGP